MLFDPNTGAGILGVLFEPKAKAVAGGGALVIDALGTNGVEAVVAFVEAPNANEAGVVLFIPNEFVVLLVGNVAGFVAGLPKLNETGEETVGFLLGCVEAVEILVSAEEVFDPNVTEGEMNEGDAVLFVIGFDKPNVKFDSAGLFSSVFGIEIASVLAGLAINGDVNGVDVTGNENPPGRATELLDELIAAVDVAAIVAGKLNVTVGEGRIAVSALTCGSTLCVVVLTTLLKGVVAAVESTVLDSVLLDISFEFLISFFEGSVVLDSVTTLDGTFSTEVVVAVLKVTDVIVLKLTDVVVLSAVVSSFALDFSALIDGFSVLSTSSVVSSPRKKLNIIASFDFWSRFLLTLNMDDALTFGLTNDIEFSSSSSGTCFLSLVDDDDDDDIATL